MLVMLKTLHLNANRRSLADCPCFIVNKFERVLEDLVTLWRKEGEEVAGPGPEPCTETRPPCEQTQTHTSENIIFVTSMASDQWPGL